MPVARTRTSTSPGPGAGTDCSSIRRSFGPCCTTARMRLGGSLTSRFYAPRLGRCFSRSEHGQSSRTSAQRLALKLARSCGPALLILALAHQAAAVPTVTASDESGFAGDEVVVTLSVTDVTDLISVGASLDYDPAVLQYSSATATANVPGDATVGFVAGPPFQALLSGFQTPFTLGSLVTITFQIQEAASPGSTPLTLLSADLGVDLGESEIELPSGQGTLIDGSVLVQPPPAVPTLTPLALLALAVSLVWLGRRAAA